MGRLFAVLVGIDDYPPPVPSLRGCRADVEAARLLLLERHDQAFDLKRQLARLPVGPARAVGQLLQPDLLVALENLVAGLSG